MKKVTFFASRGEIATLLTLISVGLMLLGTIVGSYVAQRETRVRSNAATPKTLANSNIDDFCLGSGGNSKIATVFCLPWGQNGGKSAGPHYCCDECDPGQANSWTMTCYRPNSQSSNYQGPCNNDAGVAFPLACDKDPIDNKWKWVSQNHYGECNVSCVTGAVPPTLTQTPSNTPVPIENTPTSTPASVNPPTPTDTPIPNQPTNTPIPTPTPTPRSGGPGGPPVNTSTPSTDKTLPTETPTPTATNQTQTTLKTLTCHMCSGQYKSECVNQTLKDVPYSSCGDIGELKEGVCAPDSCVKETLPTETPTPTLEPKQTCQFIDGGDRTDQENKYDVIILGDGFVNVYDFEKVAKNAVKIAKESNLNDLFNKMNFWINNNIKIDENDRLYFPDGPINSHMCPKYNICWNEKTALQLQTQCHGDAYIIISYNINGNKTTGRALLNSNAAIVAYDYPQIFIHELSHAKAGLWDEYPTGNVDDKEYVDLLKAFPNCTDKPSASQTIPCPKWANLGNDSGCYPTCGNSNWYRPGFFSIMDNVARHYPSTKDYPFVFNKPSLIGWEEALKKYI